MEIHKPKPWHGFREFLKEYLIIVIGVLTALAFEQAAEFFRWRHEAEAQREALRAEARDNLSAAAYREAQYGCVKDRLAELEEAFRHQASGAPLGLKRPVGRPPNWTATTGSWDIAVSGQALAHMPQTEKLSFSNAFDTYRAWVRLMDEEDQIWGQLDLLDHADLLGPSDWAALHKAYGEASAMNERLHGLGHYLLTQTAMGEKPSLLDSAQLESNRRNFCRPLI